MASDLDAGATARVYAQMRAEIDGLRAEREEIRIALCGLLGWAYDPACGDIMDAVREIGRRLEEALVAARGQLLVERRLKEEAQP